MSKIKNIEVGIVGAGLVGLFSALVMAKKGFKVSLFNHLSLEPQAQDTPLNARSLALSWSSKQILQAFDCWQDIQTYCQNINTIEVSSAGHWGVTRLNNTDVLCDALGYVIESVPLHDILLQQVKNNKAITLNEHYQCETLTHTPESTKLTFKHKDKPVQVNCKLTIICDGAYSPTRDKAGFTTIKDDYRQTAITANISGKHCNNHIAYERFISTGPMAMLPLNNNRYGLVWSNSAERSEQLMQLNDNEFLQQLQQSFGYRLGKLTQIGTRTSFALKKVLSQQLTLERCVVLGNSAHNLHPVAGQSLNLALRDIAHLYDHITHLDDSTQALVRYEKSRSKDHLQVMQLSDNLVSLFSNNLPVLNHARSAALAALDCLPALKNSIAWRGMGYAQSAASAQRGQLED